MTVVDSGASAASAGVPAVIAETGAATPGQAGKSTGRSGSDDGVLSAG